MTGPGVPIFCCFRPRINDFGPLFDTMPRDDEKSAVQKPTVSKEIVSEIALKQQKKESEADGAGDVEKKIGAPFRALAVEATHLAKIEPEAEQNGRESQKTKCSGFPHQLAI